MGIMVYSLLGVMQDIYIYIYIYISSTVSIYYLGTWTLRGAQAWDWALGHRFHDRTSSASNYLTVRTPKAVALDEPPQTLSTNPKILSFSGFKS